MKSKYAFPSFPEEICKNPTPSLPLSIFLSKIFPKAFQKDKDPPEGPKTSTQQSKLLPSLAFSKRKSHPYLPDV
jgi:hypothetical protein